MDAGMKASILVNYRRHTGRMTNIERSEEATFDTDQSSFIEEASILIDLLDNYVTNARARTR
jgi:hypothetical protein